MKEPKQVTTISFEGDATLWDFQKIMRHSLSITLDELRRRVTGAVVNDLSVDKMIEIRNRMVNHTAIQPDHEIYHATIIGGELKSELSGSTDLCGWHRLHPTPDIPLVDLAEVGVRVAQKAWPLRQRIA